jgi:DNA-binding phage protein
MTTASFVNCTSGQMLRNEEQQFLLNMFNHIKVKFLRNVSETAEATGISRASVCVAGVISLQ